jgi:hypothetical protein
LDEEARAAVTAQAKKAIVHNLPVEGVPKKSELGLLRQRVDLGVRHPDKPGAYLAGVECDGATYHRSAVARDRDKTRQMVLENLGWNVLRVWSPDWWYDAASAIDKLNQQRSSLPERWPGYEEDVRSRWGERGMLAGCAGFVAPCRCDR